MKIQIIKKNQKVHSFISLKNKIYIQNIKSYKFTENNILKKTLFNK